jgi:hypothetical protein
LTKQYNNDWYSGGGHCGAECPTGFDINARCLDNGLDFLQINPFDGQNWEDSVDAIR